MPMFEATARVAAPAQAVWTALLRTERWTAWDPALDRVDGDLVEGGRLEIRSRGRSRPFRLRVEVWQPPHVVALTGGMPLGLFRGTRTYTLREDGAATSVTMSETYAGPLAGMIGRSVPDLQPSFDAFVAGLKAEAEAASSGAADGRHATKEQA